MKNVKRFVLGLAAALTLAGCGLSQSISPATTKSDLEAAGYKVSLKTEAEYQADPTALVVSAKASDGFQNYLTATTAENFLFAWYFDTIDHAGTWYEAHIADFANIKLVGFGEDVQTASGTHNNVAYYGTAAAKDTAKFKI
ncbi:MAG: hypothetical protein J6038_05180 [Bacilli bacterium]|nr:hypothetical protein [Bacilli bacterium]